MAHTDLTGDTLLPNRKSALRWAVVAVLVALVSLQVAASSHAHTSADLQHCDVCLQASHAPLASKIILPVVMQSLLPIADETIASAPTLTPERTVIRGPPTAQ